MSMDRVGSEKINFAARSLDKAKTLEKQRDEFLRFIVLWIGLNALYDDGSGQQEGRKINDFFKGNRVSIDKVVGRNNEAILRLVDFVQTEPQHTRIAQFIETRRAFLVPRSKDSALHFGHVLKKVRENVFHATKLWDEEKEQQLLILLNPILEDMINELISSGTSKRK